MTDGFAERLRAALELIDSQSTHGAGNRKAVAKGALLGDLASPELQALIAKRAFDGIPTMVSPRELRLLYNFFSVTPLDGAVLEIGPYLGGSTAAIGRGLALAGHQHPFITVDAFAWNDPGFLRDLGKHIDRIGVGRAIAPSAVDTARAGDWHALFLELHKAAPYSAMLQPIRFRMPSANFTTEESLASVLPQGRIAAIFIDGFKSWQATYYAMRQLAGHLMPNTLLIFQDFSWFDCYWLPILRTRFSATMIAKVDNTAVFRLDAPVLPSALEQFGASPDPEKFDRYHVEIENHARAMLHSGDDVGYVGHIAQLSVLARVMKRNNLADAALRRIDEMKIDWLAKALRAKDFTIKAG